MGILKGQKEYYDWERGNKLTTKNAILANCYMCNGLEESGVDCEGNKSCPLYAHSPYGRRKRLHR